MNNNLHSHPPTLTPQHHPYRVGGVGLGGPSDQLPPNWGVGGSAEAFQKLCEGITVGNRNGNLLRIAIIGRARLGIESDDLAALIHAQLDGDDPLTDYEVSRAITRAEELAPLGNGTVSDAEFQRLRRHVSRSSRNEATEGERASFETMLAIGDKWLGDRWIYGDIASSALYDLSPRQFPLFNRREQAALYIERLGDDPNGYTFIGERLSSRDARHVLPTRQLAAAIRKGKMPIPPQIMLNQLNGSSHIVPATKESPEHPSMGTLKEILHRRYTEIEFDHVSVEVQARFWIGCIVSNTLVPALLVYSGSKSIHGVVRMLEPSEDGAPSDDPATCWALQRAEFELLLASANDSTYHLDRACKDATRLSRLAGHRRADTRRYQELLFLTYPEYPICGDLWHKGFCGVCEHWGDCPYTDPASVFGTTIRRKT